MPKSILREPPAGSELAARFAACEEPPTNDGDPTPALMRSHPVLREAYEVLEVRREPRLWKLPAEWIARHYLPVRIRQAHGSAAAAELARSPRLALVIAELVQALDYRHASARKRATEPAPDHLPQVRALVVAEFLNVCRDMPELSMSRQCRETARRLTGNGGKIDRAAVRRAVEGHLRDTARLPERQQAQVGTAVLSLADDFRPGWRQRLS